MGVILEVDQRDNQLVLDHEEIKGFMPKMTMGYTVSSPDLLKGLKKGDRIKFKIAAAKEVIIEITPVK